VVIFYLDVFRAIVPGKRYTPLNVYPYAVNTGSAVQRFKMIARRNSQILQIYSIVQILQPAAGGILNDSGSFADRKPLYIFSASLSLELFIMVDSPLCIV
jgi:hypothetical protein